MHIAHWSYDIYLLNFGTYIASSFMILETCDRQYAYALIAVLLVIYLMELANIVAGAAAFAETQFH
jgi:hypothetical protein